MDHQKELIAEILKVPIENWVAYNYPIEIRSAKAFDTLDNGLSFTTKINNIDVYITQLVLAKQSMFIINQAPIYCNEAYFLFEKLSELSFLEWKKAREEFNEQDKLQQQITNQEALAKAYQLIKS